MAAWRKEIFSLCSIFREYVSILLIELKSRESIRGKQSGKARGEEGVTKERGNGILFTIQFQLFSYFHADSLPLFTLVRALESREIENAEKFLL